MNVLPILVAYNSKINFEIDEGSMQAPSLFFISTVICPSGRSCALLLELCQSGGSDLAVVSYY